MYVARGMILTATDCYETVLGCGVVLMPEVTSSEMISMFQIGGGVPGTAKQPYLNSELLAESVNFGLRVAHS